MKHTRQCSLTTSSLIIAVAIYAMWASAAYGATKPKPKQPAGGANQVQGLNGKLGQMLFTGYWRFEVLAVHTDLTSYTLKVPSAAGDQNMGGYRDVATFNRVEDPTPNTFLPRAGYMLVAVDCILKNAQTSTHALDCWSGNPNTAVTDDQGQSYQPIGYDMLSSTVWTTKQMVQGSSENLTVIFAVPPGTKLKDMIFTLMTDGQGRTRKDLRISLAPPASN